MNMTEERKGLVRHCLKYGDPVTDLPALILVAVEDAKSLDRGAYRPVAGVWHARVMDGRCGVCVAGAVMAGSLAGRQTPEYGVTPSWYAPPTANALYALNAIRMGEVQSGHYADIIGEPHLPIEDGYPAMARIRETMDFSGWPQFLEHLEALEGLAHALDTIGGGP